MNTAARDTQRKEHHDVHVGIFSYTLKTGSWKKIFRAAYYKTLIAGALNSTAQKEFRNVIVGYLITDRRVCLVLRMEEKKTRRFLDHFYAHLHAEISRSLDAVGHADADRFRKEMTRLESTTHPLFTEYTLKDRQLIRLITGRKVNLPYTDQHVERLKEQIRNYPFCSAVDYNGGESPVLVKVLKSKDWALLQTGLHTSQPDRHEY